MAKGKSKGTRLKEASGSEFMKNMLPQQLQSAEWQTGVR